MSDHYHFKLLMMFTGPLRFELYTWMKRLLSQLTEKSPISIPDFENRPVSPPAGKCRPRYL